MMMPVATRVAQLIERLEGRPSQDRETGLSQRLRTWLEYYRCLHIIRKRQHDCQAAYCTALRRYRKPPAATLPGTDRRRKAGQNVREAIEALRVERFHETVSFYVFARFVVDEIAAVFCWYCALPLTRSDATHARLTQQFHACCQAHGLVCTPEAMLPLMDEVQTRLAAPPTPGQEAAAQDLTDTLTRIDAYLVAMIEVFERHRGQSACTSATREQT